MGIHTVVWICEKCGKHDSYSEEASPWDDPVLRPPDGWDYIRQGVIDAYDYTHKNVFLPEVDKAGDAEWVDY